MAETDTKGSAMTSTQIPAIRTYDVSGISSSQSGVDTLSPDDHTAVLMVPYETIGQMAPELPDDPTRIVSFPDVRVSSQSISFNTATAALASGAYGGAYDVVITAYSTASISSIISNTILYVDLTIAVLQ